MRPVYKSLTLAAMTLQISLALGAQTYDGTDTSETALPADVLDSLRVELVAQNVSGARDLIKSGECIIDGSNLTITLDTSEWTRGAMYRVQVLATFGTQTQVIYALDVTVPYYVALSDTPQEYEDTVTVVSTVGDGTGESDLQRAKKVTYAQLKALRDAGSLVAGQTYRITDYVATVANDTEARSAGHAFDVIVIATDTNKLGEQARAALHEGDTYFEGCKLEAWRLMYCIDNDTDRFAWADEENGKGVIWRMVDEWGNDAPFDFKGIQVRRYSCAVPEEKTFYGNYEDKEDNVTVTTAIEIAVTTSDSRYLGSNDITDGVSVPDEVMAKIHRYLYERFNYSDKWLAGSAISLWKNDSYAAMCVAPAYQFTASGITYYVTAVLKKTDNARWFYLFSTAYDKEDENQDWTAMAQEDILDASCDGANYSVFENIIEAQRDSGVVLLQHNLFFGNECYSNTFGNECYYNTFGNDCHSNTFGNGCYSNTFGNNCFYSTFGNDCHSNTFGNGCYSNTFGNGYYSNTFGNGCHSNTFGNGYHSNTFGNGCYSNTFGNNCFYNTFGNDCYSNTFGNECYYNTFGNGCHSNTFGNGCYSNTFGNGCYSNTFGNGCYSNTFGNECYYNTFGEGASNNAVTKDYMRYVMLESGVQYVNITCAEQTSDSAYGQNILVHSGVVGSDNARKTCSIEDAGNDFLTEFGVVQQGVVS